MDRPGRSIPRAAVWLAAVFLAGAFLRLSLALVNTEANDDHMAVITRIERTASVPIRADCHQCYHPKLFHLSAVTAIKAFSLDRPLSKTTAAQLLSCAAGIVTLWTVLLFLRWVEMDERLRLLVFAMAAFNPLLVSMSAQATNDAFAVMFSTLTLHRFFLFLRGDRRRDLALATLYLILANLSKGTALVLFPGLALVLLARTAADRGERRRRAGQLLLFLAAFMLVVPYFGQYAGKYRRHGTPFVNNVERDPPPHLLKETYLWRPGVTSVLNTYFCFRLGSMLRAPINNNQVYVYPLHRTSFWSQLYGTAHFAHFGHWPRSWATSHPWVLTMGRAIFILALIPTGLLLAGAIRNLEGFWKALRSGRPAEALSLDGTALMISAAYVLFVMIYSYNYRDFATMKAVFVFPALLCLLRLFQRGCELIRPYSAAAKAAWGACSVLCVLYAADVLWLFAQLARFRQSLP